MTKEDLFDIYAFLFARKSFRKLNSALFHASIRGLGLLNYKDDIVSGEHNFLENFLSPREKPTVIDVGGNEGLYSTAVVAVNSGVRVFAFEPHPQTYQRLLANMNKMPSVTVINAALGSSPSQMVLYDYAGSEGTGHASLHAGVIEGIHKGDSIQHLVNVMDLDTFTIEHNISTVDILKIDAEGHELEVLKGAINLLREKRIKSIQFEFNEVNVVSRLFFKDFCDFLPNFRFYRMLRDGLIPIGAYSPLRYELFAFQNIVALPD